MERQIVPNSQQSHLQQFINHSGLFTNDQKSMLINYYQHREELSNKSALISVVNAINDSTPCPWVGMNNVRCKNPKNPINNNGLCDRHKNKINIPFKN